MVVDDFPPAICGIGDYSAHLARELSDRGCNVRVLTKSQPNVDMSGCGCRVVVRPVIRNWGYADFWTVLRELDAMPRGTIVHIQYSSASNYNKRTMINALPALLRIFRKRVRVVVTMHGFHEGRRRFRLRATPLLLSSSHCIFVHHSDYEIVNRTLSIRDRTSLIPIASNIPTVFSSESDRMLTRNSIGANETDRIVLFFGDFREEKGVLDLLVAASDARPFVPNLKLVLVGGLWKRNNARFRDYAEKLQEGLRIAQSEGFLIRVNNPEPLRVAKLLRAADLAVFPFLHGAAENRGSLLAAFANETATLTTFGRSTPEGFATDYGVDMVPAGNTHALTTRIVDLLLDPHELETLRRQCSVAAHRFSWGAIADKHTRIYRDLCQGC